MRAYNSSVIDHRFLVRIAFCAVALIAGASAVPAAEVKSGGGAIGPSQGTVGGGVTGSNVGGAGGVSNPDPGGSTGAFGSPGSASGPLSTTSSRPGYLGGRVDQTVPVDPDPTLPTESGSNNPQPTQPTESGGSNNPLSTTTLPTEPGSNNLLSTMHPQEFLQLGRCDVSATRGLKPEQRMVGSNGRRLQYGSSMITSKTAGRYRTSRHVMLAGYQEELGKSKPDAVLAGTYLGIVADTPVTARTVAELNHALCVQVSEDLMERIATIAEAQRQKLASEGQTAAAALP